MDYTITQTTTLTPGLVVWSDVNGNDVGANINIAAQHLLMMADAVVGICVVLSIVLALYAGRVLFK